MTTSLVIAANDAPMPMNVSNGPQYDKIYTLPNGHASGFYKRGSNLGLPLIVVIHGGGCNAKYMDRPGYSYVEDAETLGGGCSMLLVNRPGYGGTKGTDSPNPIEASVPHIVSLINMAWREESSTIASPGVVIFGHSIGGATTYTIAAEDNLPFPLLGIAVSGFAKTHSAIVKSDWASHNANERSTWASLRLRDVAYGPPETYLPEAKALAIQGGEPPVQAELMEISHVWGDRFDRVTKKIKCPIWHGLAEYENLWEVGEKEFARMRPSYTSKRVELVELPEGGHAYTFHKRGKEMHKMQFDFAISCAITE